MISWEKKKKTQNQQPALFYTETASQLILEENITNALFKIQILRDIKILRGLSGCLSVVCAILSRYLERFGRTPKPLCPGLAAPYQHLWRQKNPAGATRPHLRGAEQARAFAVPQSCPTAGTDMPWTSWREKNILTFLSGVTWTGRTWQTSQLLPSGEVLQRQKHCAGVSGGDPSDPAQAASMALPAAGHVWGCPAAWARLFPADQPAGEGRGNPASWPASSSRAHSSLDKTCLPLAAECSMLTQS